jgi:hypothetical protein
VQPLTVPKPDWVQEMERFYPARPAAPSMTTPLIELTSPKPDSTGYDLEPLSSFSGSFASSKATKLKSLLINVSFDW